MANMSNYLENKLIDHIFRTTTFSPPSTIAIALCTTAPTDASTGSTIVEVTNAGVPANATWRGTHASVSGASSGTGGTADNAAAITFVTASADWNATVTHVAICDSATYAGGNLLFWGALSVSKTVSNGDTFSFSANQLSIQIDN